LLNFNKVPIWRQILRSNFTDLKSLLAYLELENDTSKIALESPRFSLNVPRRLVQKIQKKKWDDPILKQFLPFTEERTQTNGYVSDPVGDQGCRKSSKLIHKYQGRALLVCTSACAMHCRYCFRQNFDYDCSNKVFSNELELIRQDFSIKEIILSGGDPLSLSDATLEELLGNISTIPHIKMIRFHTRFPIGIPERIDSSFLKILSNFPRQIWFVVHVNHPVELDSDVLQALRCIQKLGIPVLNQSVLLKGVNDNVETLKMLSEKLVENGIFPYYLHELDRVQGTAHFEVEEKVGQALIKELTRQLPGYAIPKYVREIAGYPNKVSLVTIAHFI
jgi:EF-P beta-lysylation protein EpmB